MSFVTMTEKKLTIVFVKGKASAFLEEGLSGWQISQRVDVPCTTSSGTRKRTPKRDKKIMIFVYAARWIWSERKTCFQSDRFILCLVKNNPIQLFPRRRWEIRCSNALKSFWGITVIFWIRSLSTSLRNGVRIKKGSKTWAGDVDKR